MVDIRRAGVKDHGIIETFLLEFARSQGTEPESDRDSWDRVVLELLNSDQWVFWLAYHDDEPVGIAAINFLFSLYGASEEAILAALYVDDDFRRKGIGSELMEFILMSARRRGCRSVEAKIPPEMEAIISFYRRFNYQGEHVSLTWNC
jgi:GNAT superfamily N-acetyltransferase